MRSDTKNLVKGLGFVSPWLIGFCAFTLVPISLSLYYSFCNYSLLQKPVFIGLDNYRALMHDPNFWTVNFNTFLYAVLALPAGLLIALALALLLNVKIRGQSIYRTLIFLPSLVPAVAAAMLWLWLFNSKLGLVNFVLRGLGMSDPPGWLTDVHWALPSLVIISFWGVGNTVVIFLAGLQDVPTELFEAAELDGAGRLQTLRHVTLPCHLAGHLFQPDHWHHRNASGFRSSLHHDPGRSRTSHLSLHRIYVRQRVRLFENGLLQRDGMASVAGDSGPHRDRVLEQQATGSTIRASDQADERKHRVDDRTRLKVGPHEHRDSRGYRPAW